MKSAGGMCLQAALNETLTAQTRIMFTKLIVTRTLCHIAQMSSKEDILYYSVKLDLFVYIICLI